MSDSNDLPDRVERLETELQQLKWSLPLLFGFLFLTAFAIDITAQLGIPALARLFDEMLPGEPLPALTNLVIQGRALSLVIDAVLLGIVVALAVGRKRLLLVPIGAIATTVLLLKATITGFALRLPFLTLLDKLGG